jgi:hypothetical protein
VAAFCTHITFNFENIDHGKFFVVIGINKDRMVGFFFINSDINKYIQNKPEMLAVQYPLLKKDYSFLQYDSFLCANEIEEIKKTDIVQGIKQGNVKFIDELRKTHLNEILNMVRNSRLFDKKQKQLYFY